MRRARAVSCAGWIVAALALAALALFAFESRDSYVGAKVAAALPPPAARVPADWSDASARLLIVGDSRVARWRPLPAPAGFAVAMSGVGGETSRALAARFSALLAETKPDRVAIQTGVNDLVAASLAPEAAAAILGGLHRNLARTVQDARAAGVEPILFTIVRPAAPGLARRVFAWSDDIHDYVRAANRDIRALAAAEDVAVIDADALFPGEGALPPAFAVDALHFAPAAYAALNRALAELLVTS